MIRANKLDTLYIYIYIKFKLIYYNILLFLTSKYVQTRIISFKKNLFKNNLINSFVYKNAKF